MAQPASPWGHANRVIRSFFWELISQHWFFSWKIEDAYAFYSAFGYMISPGAGRPGCHSSARTAERGSPFPPTRPHQPGKPAPWPRGLVDRNWRWWEQTLLLTPRGEIWSSSQQPASLPGLGGAWEARSTIPNLKPSAVQEELLGPKRSAEQCFFFPVPLLPLSVHSFVCSKLQFSAHYQVSEC